MGDAWTWTRAILLIALSAALCSGCTVCSANRVFPKLAWRWSHDGQLERDARKSDKAYHDTLKTGGKP